MNLLKFVFSIFVALEEPWLLWLLLNVHHSALLLQPWCCAVSCSKNRPTPPAPPACPPGCCRVRLPGDWCSTSGYFLFSRWRVLPSAQLSRELAVTFDPCTFHGYFFSRPFFKLFVGSLTWSCICFFSYRFEPLSGSPRLKPRTFHQCKSLKNKNNEFCHIPTFLHVPLWVPCLSCMSIMSSYCALAVLCMKLSYISIWKTPDIIICSISAGMP